MSDPFRDDRDAQLARATALEIENEQLRRERDALKVKLTAQPTGVAAPSVYIPSTHPKITFHIRGEQKFGLSDPLILDGYAVKIGTMASAHLRICDTRSHVSRMHAIIEANTAAEACIIDLGSVSGTYVNGQRINKSRIKTGDVIRIGDVEMEIAISEGQVAK